MWRAVQGKICLLLKPGSDAIEFGCGDVSDCGIAQVFDFSIDGNKIWFTEWVENNIGVVDTSVALPLEIELESNEIILTPGESKSFNYIITPKSENLVSEVSLVIAEPNDFLNVSTDSKNTFQLDSNTPRTVDVVISANENVPAGTYKILLGAQTPDIAISKYVTLTVLPWFQK